jgi:hypothetical protein
MSLLAMSELGDLGVPPCPRAANARLMCRKAKGTWLKYPDCRCSLPIPYGLQQPVQPYYAVQQPVPPPVQQPVYYQPPPQLPQQPYYPPPPPNYYSQQFYSQPQQYA